MCYHYPISKIETLFAEISGCQKFVKLDLKHAYQQMLLDESTRELLTVNTHLGLFKLTRLAFGVKSATGIFQRTIEKKLKVLKKETVVRGDILVGGMDDVDLCKILREVFAALRGNGWKLTKEKCLYLLDEICYLGYKINKCGLNSIPEKLDAILNAPTITNVVKLKAFLGMLNYYRKFLNRL